MKFKYDNSVYDLVKVGMPISTYARKSDVPNTIKNMSPESNDDDYIIFEGTVKSINDDSITISVPGSSSEINVELEKSTDPIFFTRDAAQDYIDNVLVENKKDQEMNNPLEGLMGLLGGSDAIQGMLKGFLDSAQKLSVNGQPVPENPKQPDLSDMGKIFQDLKNLSESKRKEYDSKN